MRLTAIPSMLAVVALAAMTGCGSSDSNTSGEATSGEATSTAASQTEDSATAATTPADGGATTGGGIVLPVTDAAYGSGRVHVEFGGDSGGAVEIDGGGVVIGGFASISFTDTNSQALVSIGVGGGEPGAAAFTWDGISSAGEFGKECSITFTKGDQTALEGEFTCTGMDAVSATSTDVLHVDAKGSFKLAASP